MGCNTCKQSNSGVVSDIPSEETLKLLPSDLTGSSFLFRLIAFLIDPFLHSLGYWILVEVSALKGIWTFLYNIPIFPYTRFNNTVVMGGLILSVVLLYPVFMGIKVLIRNYRDRYEEKIKKWKIIKVLRGSKLFKFFGGLKNLEV